MFAAGSHSTVARRSISPLNPPHSATNGLGFTWVITRLCTMRSPITSDLTGMVAISGTPTVFWWMNGVCERSSRLSAQISQFALIW